jgi:hypothetical protein
MRPSWIRPGAFLAISFLLEAMSGFQARAQGAPNAQSKPGALAKGLGFPGGKPMDIRGIFPGMSLAAAAPIMRSHPRSAGEFAVRTNWFVTGEPVYEWMATNGSTNDRLTTPNDELSVWLSKPLAGSEIIGIQRTIRYDVSHMPDREETAKSLEQKYGKPTRVENPPHPGAGFTYWWRYNSAMSSATEPFCYTSIPLGSASRGLRFARSVHPQTTELLKQVLSDHLNMLERIDMECGVTLAVYMDMSPQVKDRIASITLTMSDLTRAKRARDLEVGLAQSAKDARERAIKNAPKAAPPKF